MAAHLLEEVERLAAGLGETRIGDQLGLAATRTSVQPLEVATAESGAELALRVRV